MKRLLIGSLFLTFLLGACSNEKKYNSYECQGQFKTMFFNLPTKFKVINNYLSMKYIGDIEILQGLEEKYKFDLLHSNGVLVTWINSDQISFKALGVNGNLLLEECELHFPIESEYSQKVFDILPTLSLIFGNPI